MNKTIERTYGKTIRSIMCLINPIKKKLIKSNCIVHRYVNLQSIEVLKARGYFKEYNYFKYNINGINKGACWADEDFKSSNHFFHVFKNVGLYGFSDSLTEFNKYYKAAVDFNKKGDILSSFCFLGAACHLVQDSTVPHHAHKSLLNNHREFENWLKNKMLIDYSYNHKGVILRYLDKEDYIKRNAEYACETENKYSGIYDKREKYIKISIDIINRAEESTAGLLLDFYADIL